MSITSKPFGQGTLPPGARLRATAALLACAFALAAVILCPLSSEKAYADQKPTIDIGPVVVTAPAFTGGELLPIELKELEGFPKKDGGAHFALESIDNQTFGISDIRLDPSSGVVIPIVKAGGTAPSDTQFDTIKIKVTSMSAYADSTIEIRVYFRPKLEIRDVAPLNGQYDPKEHGGKKFPGYTRSNTPPDYNTYLDGINATYTDAKGNSTQWTKSWTYTYRHRNSSDLMENYSQHIPSVSPYQTFSQQNLGSEFKPETPINAGPYQLVISTPYVQQAIAGQGDPAPSECAGWIVLDYDVAKAPWHNVRHEGLTLNDEPGAKDTANIPGMGNGHIPANAGKAVYTVASGTYVGLESATVDNENNTGELTVIANGKANSTTLVDEVVVNVTNMRNYEDFTVTVPVTYKAKPQASSIKGVQKVDGTYSKDTRHKGYKGKPTVTYTPYGKNMPLTTYGDDESETFAHSYVGINGTDYGPTDQAPIAAGSYTVTLSLPLDAPLTGEPLRLDFAIEKAAAPTLGYPPLEVMDAKGHSMRFLPSTSIPGDAGGKPVYRVENGSYEGLENATIDAASGELTLVPNGKGANKTDTVTVTLSGMGNYEDVTANVPVNYYPKKEDPVDRIDPVDPTEPVKQPTAASQDAGKKLVRTGDSTPVGPMAAVAGISVLVLSFGAVRRLGKLRN